MYSKQFYIEALTVSAKNLRKFGILSDGAIRLMVKESAFDLCLGQTKNDEESQKDAMADAHSVRLEVFKASGLMIQEAQVAGDVGEERR